MFDKRIRPTPAIISLVKFFLRSTGFYYIFGFFFFYNYSSVSFNKFCRSYRRILCLWVILILYFYLYNSYQFSLIYESWGSIFGYGSEGWALLMGSFYCVWFYYFCFLIFWLLGFLKIGVSSLLSEFKSRFILGMSFFLLYWDFCYYFWDCIFECDSFF